MRSMGNGLDSRRGSEACGHPVETGRVTTSEYKARRALIVMLLCSLTACANGAVDVGSHDVSGDVAIVVWDRADSDDGAVWGAFDMATGRRIREVRPGGRLERAVTSRDGGLLFMALSRDGKRELSAVKTETGVELWRIVLSTGGLPHVIDEVTMYNGAGITVSPDGSRVFIRRAEREAVPGIAALDVLSRRPVAFNGPWNVSHGLSFLAGTPSHPDGLLAFVATRHKPDLGGATGEALYLLDPVTLAPVDSILPGTLSGPANEELWSIVSAPDASGTVFIATNARLLRYDLLTHRVMTTAPWHARGRLVPMPGGDELILTDVGIWPDFPGTGLLQIYSSNLELRGMIDVSTALGGRPNGPTASVMGGAAPGSHDQLLYLNTGTESIGPLYPL